jgi:hypothetical protein
MHSKDRQCKCSPLSEGSKESISQKSNRKLMDAEVSESESHDVHANGNSVHTSIEKNTESGGESSGSAQTAVGDSSTQTLDNMAGKARAEDSGKGDAGSVGGGSVGGGSVGGEGSLSAGASSRLVRIPASGSGSGSESDSVTSKNILDGKQQVGSVASVGSSQVEIGAQAIITAPAKESSVAPSVNAAQGVASGLNAAGGQNAVGGQNAAEEKGLFDMQNELIEKDRVGCVFVCVCMYTYMYIYIIHLCMCMYVHVHTRTHTYIHTYTHTHTYSYHKSRSSSKMP